MLHNAANLRDALDRDALRRFAEAYRDRPHVDLAPNVIARAKAETRALFQRIPMPVEWTPEEPYSTFDEMRADIESGRFRVKNNGFISRILGTDYQSFRAVHDYFGHYLAGHGFGIPGELGAYGAHCGHFSPEVWPIVFNEIVLSNAYKDFFGYYHPEDKLVLFD